MANQQDNHYKIVAILFAVLTFWWVYNFLYISHDSSTNLIFGAVYGTTMTAIGVLYGFYYAKRWGGWNSVVGRAILALSLGLMAQFFGQAVFSYYNIVLKVSVPYPSLADIGYFGSIPLYIYGMWLFSKAAGVKVLTGSVWQHFNTVLIPLGLLIFSYLFFLRHYEFDFTSPLKIFLDFGYPFGQAIYVSFALLAYVLSRSTLGGLLRGNVLLFIYALLAQYVADFNFLYQSLHGTWYNGGYGDYMYLFAYFLMVTAIVQFGTAYTKINSKVVEK